jgi:hypothetical protein
MRGEEVTEKSKTKDKFEGTRMTRIVRIPADEEFHGRRFAAQNPQSDPPHHGGPFGVRAAKQRKKNSYPC